MASAETKERYEVKLGAMGFGVHRVGGGPERCVYFSHGRPASRMVCEALNSGRVDAKTAARLPNTVTGVKEAI